MRTWRLAVALVAAALAVLATIGSGVSSAGGFALSGVVQTGGTAQARPLANVKVTLFEATLGAPRVLGQARTDAAGRFVITSPQETSPSIFFAVAEMRAGIELVTVLGQNLPPTTTLNELTTVAAAYSMAQFYRTGTISGMPFGLQIAAGMNENLVTPATGESSPMLLASPNADETTSLRMTRSLANLLALCVRDRGYAPVLYRLTRKPRGPLPRNSCEALANLARNPAQNARQLYSLTTRAGSYLPRLAAAPLAWTVTVKVNSTGDNAFLFGGPGGIRFDERGIAWITNNVRQGETTSSHFLVALKPNGQPADGLDGQPLSPIFGGGILGSGLGIDVAPDGTIWEGNFGWGRDDPTSDGNGSVSQFTPAGTPLSPPLGYQGGPVRAQGIAADAEGNIWIASFGNDSVYVFRNGDPDQSVGSQLYTGSGPFDAKIAPDGTAWVVSSGGLTGSNPSSIAKFALVNGTLQLLFLRMFGRAAKGMDVDSQGNAWCTSQGDSRIYGFRPNGSLIGAFKGGGINGPWGVTVDSEDNLWVANFGSLAPGTFPGRLSKLAGINPATRPPGKKLGDPISPPTGYPIHSAGSQVLLANGDPLYGPGAPPTFIPMMRQTTLGIDRAGNIWSLNNWKPNYVVDALLNPGGDGVVIFVGLAAPVGPGH